MIRWILVGFCLPMLWSCQQEKGTSKTDLIGAWEIIIAIRNGQETETLNGAFFEFTRDNQMTTNIMGREETSTYECENGVIKQTSHNGESQLIIQTDLESRDLLTLQTVIEDIEFTFKLRRIIE